MGCVYTSKNHCLKHNQAFSWVGINPLEKKNGSPSRETSFVPIFTLNYRLGAHGVSLARALNLDYSPNLSQ